MTSASSPRPVSALRARMIEDMTVRGFTEETHSNYIREVRAFAAFILRPPDTATAEDLPRFQLHQTQSGMQPPSINSSVSALRCFFTEADPAAGAAADHRPPCPCCGGRMIIVGTFERAAAPRAPPSPDTGVRTAMP